MNLKSHQLIRCIAATFGILSLIACSGSNDKPDNFNGLKIKLLVGSALGEFCNSSITKRPPVLIEGTKSGQDMGIQFLSSLQVGGGTKLYDSALYARNWLQHLRKNAINAVLILTDGDDSESNINLEQLGVELKKSGFSTEQRIAFFTVGYGKEGEFNPDALKKIADLNGGYYSQGKREIVSGLMANLQVEF